MASSSSAQDFHETTRTGVGPLPIKIGEIGFFQRAETIVDLGTNESNEPAQRQANMDLPSPGTAAPGPEVDRLSVSQSSVRVSKVNRKRLWNRRICFGFRFGTFLAFALHVFLLVIIVAGWAISSTALSRSNSFPPQASLFFHVAFTLLCIIQLVLLERRIYRLRVERYTFSHPGEILPSNRDIPSSLALAPWNRPPLPSYAAAVAQSGVGTGDVEDTVIAAPPPPAYGHTRGSTMLLSGFMRNSLLAQRPLSRHSLMSQAQAQCERPPSSISQDSPTEASQGTEREMRLEETLARLASSEHLP